MEVITNSKKVFEARKTNLQLLLSNHRRECLTCVRSGNCELQKLCRDYGVDDEKKFDGAKTPSQIDDSATHMVRDNSKCVLCRRCVAVCDKNQDAAVIGVNKRGFNTHIGCTFDEPLNTSACVSCGQCIVACPTGALYEKDQTGEVWAALADPEKRVVVQTAPATRATLGEAFGMEKAIETNVSTRGGIPLFENSDVIVKHYVESGIPKEEACDWAGLGCVYPCIPGRSEHYGAEAVAGFNLAGMLHMALHNGRAITGKTLGVETGDPRQFKSTEEIYNAFLAQEKYVLYRIFWLCSVAREEEYKYIRMPFNSVMPYHRMGQSKYTALDLPYPVPEILVMTEEQINAVKDAYLALGVKCTVSR